MEKIKYILLSCLFSLCSLFGSISFLQPVYAEDIDLVPTTVLEDLNKDSNFNKDDFPYIEGNLKVELLTIAECVDNSLYIYTYEPYFNAYESATSINISKTSDGYDYNNYTLTYINNEGTLFKYKVDDFILEDSKVRYYNISSIFRSPNIEIPGTNPTSLDVEVLSDNIINEIAHPVGKCFSITGSGEHTYISSTDIELITVSDQYVGFMNYPSSSLGFGPLLGYESYDIHFLAFSTDKKIENLLKADVYYTTQSFTLKTGFFTTENGEFYGDVQSKYSYLSCEDNIEISSEGWFSLDYNFKTIESAKSFIDSEHSTYTYSKGVFNSSVTSKMTDDDLVNYIGKQDWVLRFAITPYTYAAYPQVMGTMNSTGYFWNYTIVGNVSLLRLEFETEGVVYNLGVIDNKQSGDSIPDNKVDTEIEIVPSDTLDNISNKINNFFTDFEEIITESLRFVAVIFLITVIVMIAGLFRKKKR